MTKVVFETATLADAIKKADRVSPSKGQAFDKAAGIVMEVQGSPMPVVIRATNLEVFSMEWVDTVEIEGEPVSWRIPARLFAQVMASLPIGTGKTVTLEEKIQGFSSQLHLTAGRTKARFNLMDVGYYPNWSAFDPDQLFPVNDLGGRLALVEWATSKADIPINGVHLDGERAIATDKYRLATTELKIGDLAEPVTIPAGILAQILRQTGEVSMGVDGHTLMIMPDEHTQIRTVIYGDKYPGTSRIMKRDHPDRVTVHKDRILEILQRASNFAGADRIPSLKMFLGKGEIAVMMQNEEVGLLGDVLEVPGYCDHDRFEIKFTPKNLIESISNAPNDQLDIHYDVTNAKSLVYIDGGSGYEVWIMPRGDVQPSEGN